MEEDLSIKVYQAKRPFHVFQNSNAVLKESYDEESKFFFFCLSVNVTIG